ncbi:hypothetical protein E2C01_015576 [Portunus trituberculatus]|uniref:Uncharacterized protein n=1 Tax=Portunus trituberculatus TaxID=210409 RepID=A0A5B7DNB2_PORTR|nr:hypothetical protein [Portunus trituberculatus]
MQQAHHCSIQSIPPSLILCPDASLGSVGQRGQSSGPRELSRQPNYFGPSKPGESSLPRVVELKLDIPAPHHASSRTSCVH